MMHVFELFGGRPGSPFRAEGEDFARLFDQNQSVRGSVSATWIPPKVKVLQPMDFPSFGLPIVSRRAIEALRDLPSGTWEFLPLVCDEGEYYFMNVLRVADEALDMANSEMRTIAGTSRVTIERHAFNADRLAGLAVFKLSLDYATVFVTDAFVDRAAAAGLTGLDPQLIWSSDQTPACSEAPSQLPIDTILALSGYERQEALREHLTGKWIKAGERLEALTEAERTYFLVDEFESLVCWDDLGTYFESAGHLVAETLEALRRIDATHAADILEEALSPFGGKALAADFEARVSQVDALPDAVYDVWGRLSDTLCKDEASLLGLLDRYLETHRADFRP